MTGFKNAFILAFVFIGTFANAGTIVPDNAGDVCPIKIGQTLPELALQDIQGKAISLNKTVAKVPTILVFYRGSWCPYCNVHLGELQTIEKDLKKLGYQVVAVSPDLPENLEKSVEKNDLDYTLLSDSSAEVAKSLGLAFKVDEATFTKYLGYGIDLEKASGEKHHLLPVPAAIVLDTTGVVRFSFVSPDYKTRIDTKVLLAAAESAVK